ncbi:effector-associated constant component EACC1 [Micromonospora sp. DT47]|uniref:effector-associated constant component EACC1 n=1 Tax=Micromonospora sp. DT47 TaxID=3393431 RepID=UPI003CF1191D
MDRLDGLPVQLIINPRHRQPPRVALIDWIQRQPEYRGRVRDAGGSGGGRAGFSDAVIIAVVAQGMLPGLFNLLQSWVDQQRGEASVRIQAGDAEVELQVTGRSDAARLLAQATQALQAARHDAGPDPDGGSGSGPAAGG